MYSRPKILFLVSLLFVALNPKFNPYLLFKFLMHIYSSYHYNFTKLSSYSYVVSYLAKNILKCIRAPLQVSETISEGMDSTDSSIAPAVVHSEYIMMHAAIHRFQPCIKMKSACVCSYVIVRRSLYVGVFEDLKT